MRQAGEKTVEYYNVAKPHVEAGAAIAYDKTVECLTVTKDVTVYLGARAVEGANYTYDKAGELYVAAKPQVEQGVAYASAKASEGYVVAKETTISLGAKAAEGLEAASTQAGVLWVETKPKLQDGLEYTKQKLGEVSWDAV